MPADSEGPYGSLDLPVIDLLVDRGWPLTVEKSSQLAAAGARSRYDNGALSNSRRRMRNLLESDLNQLRDLVLLMGGEVEEAIEWATRALIDRDSELAEQVLSNDDRVDALELEVDQACVRVLALKSPEASDLRFVVTAVKVTPSPERISDHACNIARAAIDLNDEPQLKPYVDIPRMSRIAREMLRASLDAFAAGNAEAATLVIEQDDSLD